MGGLCLWNVARIDVSSKVEKGCLYELCRVSIFLWMSCIVPGKRLDVILQKTERSMLTAMCGLHLEDRKRAMDLMLMLTLYGAIDQ